MKIGIVIPAHNEASYLGSTLDSLLNQSLKAHRIVVVNDHSTDQTAALLNDYAAKNASIMAAHLNSNRTHMPGSKVIRAVQSGLDQFTTLPDIICKFDADLIFPEHYLETIAQHFESNPRLGMVGGLCYIEQNGRWILESLTAKDHIRGALKAYRRSCFEQMGGLKASIGWDTVDELLARFHGWQVQTDPALKVKHLKPTGARYDKSARHKQGEAFRKLGYNYGLCILAAAKGAWKRKSWSFYFDTLKGYRDYKGPLLVTEKQAAFIRNYRWKGIGRKLLGRK